MSILDNFSVLLNPNKSIEVVASLQDIFQLINISYDFLSSVGIENLGNQKTCQIL